MSVAFDSHQCSIGTSRQPKRFRIAPFVPYHVLETLKAAPQGDHLAGDRLNETTLPGAPCREHLVSTTVPEEGLKRERNPWSCKGPQATGTRDRKQLGGREWHVNP